MTMIMTSIVEMFTEEFSPGHRPTRVLATKLGYLRHSSRNDIHPGGELSDDVLRYRVIENVQFRDVRRLDHAVRSGREFGRRNDSRLAPIIKRGVEIPGRIAGITRTPLGETEARHAHDTFGIQDSMTVFDLHPDHQL